MRPIPVMDLADRSRPCGVVVVGGGVAGLTAALGLASRGVTLLAKSPLGQGCASAWAQGGVAAAIGAGDSAREHAEDTRRVGEGICAANRVGDLTSEGPERVRELMALGARFDRGEDGELLLSREGGHSRRRVLRAGGDSTGAEMMRALVAAVREESGIEVVEGATALDLVLAAGRVTGVLAKTSGGETVYYRSGGVVLATGGLGQVYGRTTNPAESTGDGIALAARAGAQMADLEFVQFHPTALDLTKEGSGLRALPLVTEALRGEGAVLVNGRGERFMLEEHPMAELAPRDVVARAIWRQQGGGEGIFLDATSAVGEEFPERFPTVYEHCRKAGIDPRVEPIPVTPAAHYVMGGLEVDGWGRTSLPGLFACGEVTSTGVHGANRLASNSLLEGLVFGARVAEALGGPELPRVVRSEAEEVWREVSGDTGNEISEALRPAEIRRRLHRLMWGAAGLVRQGEELEGAQEELAALSGLLAEDPTELRNLLTVARLIVSAALFRQESRGAHFRSDHPEKLPAWRRRLIWTYDPDQPFPLREVGESARVMEGRA